MDLLVHARPRKSKPALIGFPHRDVSGMLDVDLLVASDLNRAGILAVYVDMALTFHINP